MYDVLLFDLDNTLLDFDAASHMSWKAMMGKYDLPTGDEHHSLYQEINARLWARLEYGQLHQDQIKVQRWSEYFMAIKTYRDPVEANDRYFDGLADYCIKIDGADTLLHELRDRPIAIITNGIGAVQRRRLAKTGWDKYIDAIIISDEVGSAKPQSRIFDLTYQALNVSPHNSKSLIVGDTLKSDIKGGQDYGIDTCWHNTQNSVARTITPTHTVQSLHELHRLLIE